MFSENTHRDEPAEKLCNIVAKTWDFSFEAVRCCKKSAMGEGLLQEAMLW